MAAPLPLLVTMGEPAGIGPELTAQAWHRRQIDKLPPFAYVGDADHLAARAAEAGLCVPMRRVTAEEAIDCFDEELPVIHVPLAAPCRSGKPDPGNAGAVIEAIDTGVELVASGKAAGLITGPIQKSTLGETGFAYPGHTEYLGALAERYFNAVVHPVMMLACAELRVVPVTVHIPLRDVAGMLTADLIVRTGEIVARDLAARFGVANPRLAISGLNPHAGEAGLLGTEDADMIVPAVAKLRQAGIEARGPLPADTLFHPAARSSYDAVLAMYHDQALVPIKTIAFDRAVNVTLGLPFVRTSPDHGTALDLAGTGRGNPQSLIEAIRLAATMAMRGKNI